MYRAFYGLREKPFNLTPDPRFLYLSDKHKEAFAHLLYGIRSRTGFVMVTGEIGTGKTTICRNLLNQLDEDTELAFIFNPMLSPLELLKKIASEFGVDTKGANTLELTEELNQYLLEAAAKEKNCVLLIDEAQNLDPQVLEQIRLLSNLETEAEKLLQIVLIGQPELGEKLALHELRQLNQRITARYHLRPLSEKEVMQYVAYRLHVAGGRRTVKFAKSAIRAVYKISGGTPRVINALCDRALLIGFTKEVHTITAPIVHRAYREIRGDDIFGKGTRFGLRRLLWNPIAAVTAALLVAIAFANSPVLRQRTQGYLDRLASYLPEAEPVILPEPAATVADPRPTSRDVAAGTAASAAVSTPPPPVGGSTPTAEVPALPETTDPAPAQPLPQSLVDGTEADATRGALQSVLAAWQRSPAGAIPANLDGDALVAFARDNGLAIEFLSPAIDQLLALDLPAVIQIEHGDAVRSAALTAVDDNVLTLASGETTWTMERADFRNHYTGNAVILWDDPAPGAPALLPGSRGVAVRGLRAALADLGRIPAPDSADSYDGAVSKAVARLQAETSLDVDGIAGKQVRMVLQSWAKPDGTPSLGVKVARLATGPAPAAPTAAAAPASPAAPARSPRVTPPTPETRPIAVGEQIAETVPDVPEPERPQAPEPTPEVTEVPPEVTVAPPEEPEAAEQSDAPETETPETVAPETVAPETVAPETAEAPDADAPEEAEVAEQSDAATPEVEAPETADLPGAEAPEAADLPEAEAPETADLPKVQAPEEAEVAKQTDPSDPSHQTSDDTPVAHAAPAPPQAAPTPPAASGGQITVVELPDPSLPPAPLEGDASEP